ncbi:ciliary microtubule associated protein 1A [Pelodiscus sinensis]|uniref:Ciliary microtubule associated protein 1A n=1 Tax=Pelodiscus sinensis TaxID=13735 RepID=K7GAG4_PELSI|nr:outer dense fiber protein 3 [Pelodiscus sinensis]XP_025042049.1 outer dense fiber protein 3 [Pelodiscus sinensis]XP_025042053.1 outer dense fiber protein 3 [Pelodiscus sinensis]|eukprot:XP_006111815.1 outer dense fiber protein 3 [Pelodiscus sinensis]
MHDSAWVGTWRPHRPRGPVMAQFTSPGPKYWIEGTTGYMKHNPTKRKAPAYTFKGAKPLLNETCSPGPYSVESSMTRNGKGTSPAYTMCGRPKVKTEVTPGPSDYSPEKSIKHVYKCAPVQSISFRTRCFRVDGTPGPAAYTIPGVMGPNTVDKTASPCYSMKWKSKLGRYDEDLHQTPGPAAYRKVEVDVYKKRAPKYSMSTRSKPAGNAVQPGPGDYYPGKVTLIKPCAPTVTFGIRHSEYTMPLIVDVY